MPSFDETMSKTQNVLLAAKRFQTPKRPILLRNGQKPKRPISLRNGQKPKIVLLAAKRFQKPKRPISLRNGQKPVRECLAAKRCRKAIKPENPVRGCTFTYRNVICGQSVLPTSLKLRLKWIFLRVFTLLGQVGPEPTRLHQDSI